MPDGQVLEFTRVTKRFNDVTAVSDFSARVEPGVVTAFLGPNGAGKTTSLRILLGQVRASSGTATIGGVSYPELRHPLRTIGAVLEETVYRPRRSAARQLTIAAKANGIPLSRVDEVLSIVGLGHESEGRIGGFSLGMRQRLSVAHALLGDPGALVFDEPANGLDPEGIRWMRLLMRRLADEGRTVLVSSHVLSEVEQVADHVLVLSKGNLVLSSGIETLADPASGSVVVDADDRAALRTALSAGGFEVEVLRSGLTVRGGDAGTVGAIAASAGIALSTLVQRGPTLEDVFLDLVRGGRLAPREVAAAPVAAAAALRADDPSAPIDPSVSGAPIMVDGAAVAEKASETDAAPIGADDDAPVAAEEPAAGASGAEPETDAAESETSFDDILFGNGESAAPTAASGDTRDADADSVRGDDPRSAAVSSMLAAAARAYYDDEPADYPSGDEDHDGHDVESGESEAPETEAPDDDAHWSVASTGVIDAVPAWTPADGSEDSEDHPAKEQGEPSGQDAHEHQEDESHGNHLG